MIKIDKIKKSIYFLNINYMLHYNNNTHQIINAIIMMSRTQYNYIDELNGFINDALDYEDEEDHRQYWTNRQPNLYQCHTS